MKRYFDSTVKASIDQVLGVDIDVKCLDSNLGGIASQ